MEPGGYIRGNTEVSEAFGKIFKEKIIVWYAITYCISKVVQCHQDSHSFALHQENR